MPRTALTASLRLPWTAVGRVLALAVVLAVALLGPAAPARAGFIDAKGLDVTYHGVPSEINRLTVTPVAGGFAITEEATAILPGGPCVQDGANESRVICDGSQVGILYLSLDDRDDRATVTAAVQTIMCGGPGADELHGGPLTDGIWGGAGADVLTGGDGVDAINGEAECVGPDPATPSANTLDGEGGDDRLYGGRGDDTLRGSAGNDYLFGLGGRDDLAGGDGDDGIVGFAGDDVLDGGPGDDILQGGDGNDVLHGGDGRDELGLAVFYSDPLLDHPTAALVADDGDDAYFGDAGDDVLDGANGERNPVFPGSATGPPFSADSAAVNGADSFDGGDGHDVVTYVRRTTAVTLSPNGAADDGANGEGDRVAGDVEELVGGAGDDTLAGGPADDVLDGAAGADAVTGAAGADVLRGGAGNDLMRGDDGGDQVDGGEGDDDLGGGTQDDAVTGGGGNDALTGGEGDDTLAGGPGDDTLAGDPGADGMDGGPGRDTVDFRATTVGVTVSLDGVRNDGEAGRDAVDAVEAVIGGPGADTLAGDDGPNVLDGGDGDDLLTGGGGADTLLGGAGVDVLLARDRVADTLRCGRGRDLASPDPADDVAETGADACEWVDEGTVGRRVRVTAGAGCRAAFRLAGSRRDVPLAGSMIVPAGTVVDARLCAVRARGGGAGEARLRGARTVVGRLRRAEATFTVVRAQGAPCRARQPALLVTARGPVLVRGARSTAQARRASWRTTETCRGTRTRVLEGTVTLRDHGHRLKVGKGSGHLARRAA